jgi:SAM-dependent methyltransferase
MKHGELSEETKVKSLDWFRCVGCGSPLREDLAGAPQENGNLAEGQLTCTSCQRVFPIVRSIPRFVSDEGYAHNWGYQWNLFEKTQLDSFAGNRMSHERFFATTHWPANMEGQVILEAGCGMGRFTEVALETGAEVFSFDLSNSVEANFRNNGRSDRVHIFQASIYEIPLKKESFDKIFCMGVLQYCPDVRRAFLSLVPFLRPGGEIVVDCYEKHAGLLPPLKYWVRPFLTWMGPEGVHNFLAWAIPPAFYAKKALSKVPLIGKPLGSLIPIGPISHAPKFNFSDEELIQVKINSALGWYAPVCDNPQTKETMRQWFTEAGLVDVYIGSGFNGINARGRRP